MSNLRYVLYNGNTPITNLSPFPGSDLDLAKQLAAQTSITLGDMIVIRSHVPGAEGPASEWTQVVATFVDGEEIDPEASEEDHEDLLPYLDRGFPSD